MKNVSARVAAALVAGALVAPAALAQQFPNKPIKAITPFPPGAGPDTVLRLVGEKLSAWYGQPFIVENRPGANAWIAMDAGKKAPADGYTIVQITNEQASIQPHIYKSMPFDVERDFEAIAPLYTTHFFVVVPINSPWNSMKDLVAAAAAKKDGSFAYGSWGVGSIAHVGGAMLEQAANLRMTHVPFKDFAQLYGSVANGDVAFAMGTAATTGPLFRAKKIKFLAIAAPSRLPTAADVPTVPEAGGPPDFVTRAIVGIFGPKGFPKAIADRMNADIVRAINEPDVREKLIGVGFEPSPGTAAALSQALAADSKRFKEVAARAKISID
jgi:tripartite-type tricarboxylate transporter receptor subunit TctC